MDKIIKELNELKDKYDALAEKDEQLKRENEQLEREKLELKGLVNHYQELLRIASHKKFAASSEKSKPEVNQTLLFDEAENTAEPKEPEPEVEEIAGYKRRKRKVSSKSVKDDFNNIPVEEVVHEHPGGIPVCPECGEQMSFMRYYSVKSLVIVPASVKVVNNLYPQFVCRRCEKENIHTPIIKQNMPKQVIKGSCASPSIVSYIMTQKYMLGIPLDRQEFAFEQQAIMLSKQTMSNWLLRTANDWLKPLYQMIRQRMLKEDILHADETTLQVLREPGRAARTQSFMWLYRTGKYSGSPAVLYEYQETRSSAHPINFLKGFAGYLHTDGYVGYGKLGSGVFRVGCWAHARRKFYEALIAIPKENREESAANKGMKFCNRLFALEREFENLTPEERRLARLEKSKPVSDEFFEWASGVVTPPKSALGNALKYALGQRALLETFYLDGRLEISNNRAERSIRPFVIGRKNWLFSCSPKGAEASAIIYSIIETAKENNLKPFEYLNYIFEKMPNIPEEEYHTLLPWSEDLPDCCRNLSASKEETPDTEDSDCDPIVDTEA